MSADDIHRRRVVVMFVSAFLIAAGFALYQIALFKFDQTAIANIAIGLMGALLCIYGLWVGLWSEDPKRTLRLLLVLLSTLIWLQLFVGGGVNAYNAAILPVLPVAATLLLKPRDAALFTALHLIALMVIAVVWQNTSTITPSHLTQTLSFPAGVVLPVLAIAACTGGAMYMSHQNNKVEGQLRALLIQQAYLAVHDYLSGLGNRVQLQQRFAASPADDEFDILLIDLDGFKSVNDTYGHEAGDHLIKTVAARLKELADETDFVIRLGGDEFVILLENVDASPADVRKFASVLIEVVSRPYNWNGQLLRISASIGHARYPLHAETPSQTLGLADKALYAAKEAGKARCVTHGERADRRPTKVKRPFTLPSKRHTRFVES